MRGDFHTSADGGGLIPPGRLVSPGRDNRLFRLTAPHGDLPYSQIERLTNLAALPSTGFTVACFPLKIRRASAGLARVVAILEGE